ncbi:MAG: diacylglycerol kinase family protein [Nocardioides sp.]
MALLDRPRTLTLTWAAVCLVLYGVLAFVVTRDRTALDVIDRKGKQAEIWALHHDRLETFLSWVELAFGGIGMTILTALLAIGLLVRHHRRSAILVVAVMVVTSELTTLFKIWLGRARPLWQNPTDLLHSNSFPSGHSSSITAFAGLVMVITLMLARKSGVRRGVYVVGILTALVVYADRVLLGRHYPTDVVGGALLGAGVLLLGLSVYSPLPRSHAASAEPLTEAIASDRSLHVVINPSKVEDVGQFKSMVAAMANEAGWSDPAWHYTTIEDPGTGMAEAASVAGADLVLVCGGDGTVREVCAELAGTGIPVGVVPAGTGNLLARNLGIPLFLRSAIDVALNGQDSAIDLVAVSGDGFEDTHFMVMAGMGLDAAIMEGVNEQIKQRVGWFAYVISGLKALMSPVVKLEVSIDGGEFTSHRARTVVIGNVGHLQAGMPLLPDAAIDDGLLDVVLLHPKQFLSWLPLVFRVLAKRPRIDDTIHRLRGQSVVVRASADTPRQLDGDGIGPGRELRMDCIHGRLLVRVPR